VILLDVNVLVYAFRRESDRHAAYAAWLARAVAGSEELALHEGSLAGFVRIVTHPRIYAEPAPRSVALAFLDRVVTAPRHRWLPASAQTWERFAQLVGDDAALTGNHVPDALLAALALTHGCRLATADRGFARFPGLDWFEPTAA
jgi:toxin-antitoxin system PIN domain toxin